MCRISSRTEALDTGQFIEDDHETRRRRNGGNTTIYLPSKPRGILQSTKRQSVPKKIILTVDRKEGIVDGDDGGVGMVEGGAHDETADAAESVDTDLDGHGFFSRQG